MATYLMTREQLPFAAHINALELNPDLLPLVDATLDQETEAEVSAAVSTHWLMQDRTYVRYINELVKEIRQTNALVGMEDVRSDERIIAMMLKKADLLDRAAPENWIAHSKTMLALFRMYARTLAQASKMRQAFRTASNDAPH